MKLSYVIVAGGFENTYGTGAVTSVEAFTGDLGKKHLPDLPNDFVGGSVFMNNGNVFSLTSSEIPPFAVKSARERQSIGADASKH